MNRVAVVRCLTHRPEICLLIVRVRHARVTRQVQEHVPQVLLIDVLEERAADLRMLHVAFMLWRVENCFWHMAFMPNLLVVKRMHRLVVLISVCMESVLTVNHVMLVVHGKIVLNTLPMASMTILSFDSGVLVVVS